MSSLKEYLTDYSQSHQHPTNIYIHTICVPAIMWSLLALADKVHVYEPLSLAHVVLFFSFAFYATLKAWKVFAGMLCVAVILMGSIIFFKPSFFICGFVFILAWIGQFYGHSIEKKKPSFVKDIFFLWIGPIWVLTKIHPTYFLK